MKKIFVIAGILALSIIPTTIFSEELTNAEWQAEAAKLEVDQAAACETELVEKQQKKKDNS